MTRTVTTWYLQMLQAGDLVPAADPGGLDIIEVEIKQFEFNRFLYQLVGARWQWVDRLTWTDERWRRAVEVDHCRTWVAWHRGAPAGYFELNQQDADTEIAYFGLAPIFFGRGFGSWLLTRALQCAWAWPGSGRVWVHTCSLDHPAALPTYQARGLKIYRRDPD